MANTEANSENKIFLESGNVQMYPSPLRGGTDREGTDQSINEAPFDPESRLSTEFNLTNFLKSLTLNEAGSFVYNYNNNLIEFYLHGYFFKLDLSTNNFSNWNNIYACIKITNEGKNQYLSDYEGSTTNLDIKTSGTYYFKGVCLKDTAPTNNEYGLQLLEKVGNTWQVPTKSRLKFDSNDVYIGDNNIKSLALSDVINVNNNNEVEINADEFTGHLTGNVTGDLDGNAKTATDSSYAQKIGTSTSTTTVGSTTKPIYLKNGIFKTLDIDVGSAKNMVYLENGTITAGIKITAENRAPKTTDIGNDGDIWIQYS